MATACPQGRQQGDHFCPTGDPTHRRRAGRVTRSPTLADFRRDPLDPTDLKYFLSNAAPDTSIDDFAAVCALRWPIETIFQQAKQYLGFNEYETRSWLGWHHHMTLVILAFGFLARSHFLLKEDAPALTLPQVVDLLAAVLPQKQFRPKEALELLRYKQRRIASAKRSHYFMRKKKINHIIFAAQ
jgi:SRSO17 transposase